MFSFFTFLLLEPWIKRLKINEGEGDNLQAVGTLAARESHYLVPTFPGVHEEREREEGELIVKESMQTVGSTRVREFSENS